MEMVKAGVIERILDILHEAPDFLCAAFAELLRILTNNATITKGPSAAKVVEPMFLLLTRYDFGPDGQHSAMQNIFNPLTPKVIAPLIRVLGSGIPLLQQRALKALVSIVLTRPNEIAKEGGVVEISKVILQADPSLPHALWESAASVLSSILQFSSKFYLEVPVAVLVRLLRSGSESTVIGALNTLLVLESDDGTSAESMAESGAMEALLELLRSHQCEEVAARLLEVLLNNVKIRETKVTKSAILPLSQQYIYWTHKPKHITQGDAVSACRALVNVLEDTPIEEMKVVAICALQNLVMYSRPNRRAVAEAGGVQVVLDLIGSSNPEASVQAAMFIKLLFSNNTIQEYASIETVRAITGSETCQEAALDALFLLTQAWLACPAEVSRAQSIAAADAIPFLQ
ncbi:hypothetical protein TSUD_131840 [Trifolium subterraneum]|uniref:Armadillo repeat-containing domain-containing protein n=1 Tax=Trifolium subterraneum TaxID=3900 RepID=A0A2Z6LGT1_TRISU|nr:hypothetical protein TSUD_131840 [Trifolium subterraneum]